MKKYEHKVITTSSAYDSLVDCLNNGWEIVSATHVGDYNAIVYVVRRLVSTGSNA